MKKVLIIAGLFLILQSCARQEYSYDGQYSDGNDYYGYYDYGYYLYPYGFIYWPNYYGSYHYHYHYHYYHPYAPVYRYHYNYPAVHSQSVRPVIRPIQPHYSAPAYHYNSAPHSYSSGHFGGGHRR